MDLWLRAAGGTVRQFQQRREMGRLNHAEADARRVAAERAAHRQAASRRKAVALLTMLVLAVTVPTWAIVSAVTAPSVHNGDTSQLNDQAAATLDLEPAPDDPATVPAPTQTPDPEPSPEVAGVSKPPPAPVKDDAVTVTTPGASGGSQTVNEPTRPAPKPVTRPEPKPTKNPPKSPRPNCDDPGTPGCGDDGPAEQPTQEATTPPPAVTPPTTAPDIEPTTTPTTPTTPATPPVPAP